MSHTTRKHARLAPSAAHRWMKCPGSVRLSEQVPVRVASVFADEGTAAHMLAERCLENGQVAADYAGGYLDIDANLVVTGPGDRRFLIDDQMVEGVQMYLDYVYDLFDKCDFYTIEQRIDLTHIHPELFGTGDASGYIEATEHLHVVDFKYGKGVAVEPEENEQLLCYAAGLVRNSFRDDRPVRKVTLHIVQPRANHPKGPIRSWTATLSQLRDFERSAQAKALLTEDPDAPLVAGDHCKFCPAAAICPERRKTALEAAKIEFGEDGTMIAQDPATMSSAELGRIFAQLDQIEDYCKRVREFAYAEALEGRVPDGTKIVAKRPMRRWKDEAKAVATLRMIFDLDDNEIFTRKLISPAAADKLVGKDGAKQLAALWSKESSGTTLVTIDDPREPVRGDPSVEFGE